MGVNNGNNNKGMNNITKMGVKVKNGTQGGVVLTFVNIVLSFCLVESKLCKNQFNF